MLVTWIVNGEVVDFRRIWHVINNSIQQRLHTLVFQSGPQKDRCEFSSYGCSPDCSLTKIFHSHFYDRSFKALILSRIAPLSYISLPSNVLTDQSMFRSFTCISSNVGFFSSKKSSPMCSSEFAWERNTVETFSPAHLTCSVFSPLKMV